MKIYNELESLGFFEWLSETHNLKDTDMTPECLDELLLDDIHRTVCNSMAFRWFREKYELSCSIELTDNSRHYYYDFTISDSKNRDYNDEDCFDSCKRIYDDGKFGKYEEAELECLIKLISIVKEK